MYPYYNVIEAQRMMLQSGCRLHIDPPFDTPWTMPSGMPLRRKEPEWSELYAILERSSLYLNGFTENRLHSYRRILNIKYACGRFEQRDGAFIWEYFA